MMNLYVLLLAVIRRELAIVNSSIFWILDTVYPPPPPPPHHHHHHHQQQQQQKKTRSTIFSRFCKNSKGKWRRGSIGGVKVRIER